MITLKFFGDIKGSLSLIDPKIIHRASVRSISRVLDSTAAFAAKLGEKKLKVKQKAIKSVIKVKKPKQGFAELYGDLSTKGGERIPLSGFPTKIRVIRKVPKNYKTKKTVRSYQQVFVKLWGRDTYTELKGAFRVKLKGRKAQTPSSGRPTRLAILKRVTEKRLKVRQLLTNQPDIASFLSSEERAITLYAQERMGKEFDANLNYYKTRAKP
ncbi:MAG: hypothetical protein EOP04_24140 [Proteobacteria bacterium]|nr:MAG: hypothetical protein EOP04_24140 [Pseudomonadota bacterium]